MRRFLSRVEYRVILALGRATIDYPARYLRNPSPLHSHAVLSAFGATIGTSRIKGSLFLDNYLKSDGYAGDFSSLNIGDNCYIGDAVYIDLASGVTMGDNAMVSARCSLLTHLNAHRSAFLNERFPPELGPVEIGQGAWLGAEVTVLPGVTIGPQAAIAGGAVVTEDVPDRTLVAGVPAKPLRRL